MLRLEDTVPSVVAHLYLVCFAVKTKQDDPADSLEGLEIIFKMDDWAVLWLLYYKEQLCKQLLECLIIQTPLVFIKGHNS